MINPPIRFTEDSYIDRISRNNNDLQSNGYKPPLIQRMNSNSLREVSAAHKYLKPSTMINIFGRIIVSLTNLFWRGSHVEDHIAFLMEQAILQREK